MDIIDTYTNASKLTEKYLGSFIAGYTGKQTTEITALVEKINHMMFDIGCPVSVKPMLQAIANRKIKKWFPSGVDNYNGKQTLYKVHPKTHIAQAARIAKADVPKKLEHLVGDSKREFSNAPKQGYHVGHFRWNWEAYMLDRQTTDYIKEYFKLN
jgi:hypothetical protein